MSVFIYTKEASMLFAMNPEFEKTFELVPTEKIFIWQTLIYYNLLFEYVSVYGNNKNKKKVIYLFDTLCIKFT